MVALCPHCARTNIADAKFCYYDGASLVGNGHAQAAVVQTFPRPFVFASGLKCHTFDEFAGGCVQHWDEAVDLLGKGFLRDFFGGMGRMDLVQSAQEAAAFPDRDRGLDMLLVRLPVRSLPPPQLDVQPKQIDLGILSAGQDGEFKIRLANKGSRLIFGSIVSNCKWLTATDSGEPRVFQFRQQFEMSIKIKGSMLRAAAVPVAGGLCVETNAGTFNLAVTAQVPIQPYADGVLAGARTPRELAERAKAAPKQAAPCFENGAVARWYQSNGWTYPVQGPAANGLAAVQQYFEALGLSKPPKVQINQTSIALQGKPGELCNHRLEIRGAENRPVFASGACDAPWVVVRRALLQGTLATLPIEVTVPEAPGETLRTVVKIRANGNQEFDVPLELTVVNPAAIISERDRTKPLLAERVIDVTHPSPARPANNNELASLLALCRPLLHTLPLAMLAFILLGLGVIDAFSNKAKKESLVLDEPQEERHAGAQEARFNVAIQDEPDEGPVIVPARFKIDDEPEERIKLPPPPVKVEIKDEPAEIAPGKGVAGKGVAIDPSLRIAYAYDNRTKRWGLVDSLTRKKLTFSEKGETNTTIVRVAGKSLGFGGFGNVLKLPDDPVREARMRSSYSYIAAPGLKVTQFLEIVPSKQPVDVGGQQRRLMDTLLVRYLFENTGKQQINAGLRLEVDTLIGNNDGVPFTVPGRGLVNTSADFLTPLQVPDFVQALETGDLRNPGTIVHVSFKVGGGIESPGRVTLCHWSSNGDLSNIRPTNMGNDSAIIMVWPDQSLPPGQKREMGYAYGLGTVTVADPGGTMAVTLGGNFDIGQSFTITAYVNKPAPGQTLTLDLPAGLSRIKGEQSQRVPTPGVGTTSIVSWEAKVLQTGVFPVKVRSSTGITQTKTVTIARGEAPSGGKLSLELRGDFEPGKTFTVVGRVNEPVPKQTLTLQLPAGLEKVSGDFTQAVPPPPPGSPDAVVSWQVRVTESGKYPVRVTSSNGVTQTKTITIAQRVRSTGLFQMSFKGDFEPGKTFTVSASPQDPMAGQQFTLVLPAGLELVDGAPVQNVQEGTAIAWKVKIAQAGKYSVGVRSSDGVTQRKTLTIEPPGAQGRFSLALLDLQKDIRPGQEFRVKAQVDDPLPGQTLTLVLPRGLQLTGGTPVRSVPAGAGADVVWTVRLVESGRLPVRVESSTGSARTKTIQLTDSSSTLFGR